MTTVLTKEQEATVKAYLDTEIPRRLEVEKAAWEVDYRKRNPERPDKTLGGSGETGQSRTMTFAQMALSLLAEKSGRMSSVDTEFLRGLTRHPQDSGANSAYILDKALQGELVPQNFHQQMAHIMKGVRAYQSGGYDSIQKAGMMEAAAGTGGALVPTQFIPQLQIMPLEPVNLRSYCRVFPVGSPTVRIPAILDTTHAGGTVFGGIIAQWEGEAVTIPTSQPTFNSIELTSRKLTLYTPVTNELLSDSPISIDALIGELSRQAMAWKENKAIIRGTGVGEPLGWLNSAALVTIAKEVAQPAATILYANINKMWDALWPAWRPGSIWVVNPECGQQLRSMSLTIGVAGAAAFLPAGGLSGAPFDTLMGRPIIWSEHASAVGTVGDINLVNLQNYLIGDRQQMTMSVSEHFLFGSDQTAFRLIERLDGKPWLQSALTPANGSITYSSFVALATRA